MRHYQVFGEATEKLKERSLISAASWDTLREEHPFFSIPDSREEWLAVSELTVQKDGQDANLIERARAIVELIRQNGYTKLFSVGSGGAALEYQIKKLIPELSVMCSDYSPVTVQRLKKVFIESEDVVLFDLVEGDWQAVRNAYLGEKGLCLMYRLDAGFDDATWKQVFGRMAEAGVDDVLVIPTGTLTMLSVYNRKRRELVWHMKRIPIVFSGYLRTKARFYEQWGNWYQASAYACAGLTGFLLKKKGKN
jgi:hypothetical protein